jgi:hypothetical protein
MFTVKLLFVIFSNPFFAFNTNYAFNTDSETKISPSRPVTNLYPFILPIFIQIFIHIFSIYILLHIYK